MKKIEAKKEPNDIMLGTRREIGLCLEKYQSYSFQQTMSYLILTSLINCKKTKIVANVGTALDSIFTTRIGPLKFVNYLPSFSDNITGHNVLTGNVYS